MALVLYFAGRTSRPIGSVVAKLQQALELPPFSCDTHDSWRYCWASTAQLSLNVTKTRGFGTIHSWMSEAPVGVNLQVVLRIESAPSPDALTATLRPVFLVTDVLGPLCPDSLTLYHARVHDA